MYKRVNELLGTEFKSDKEINWYNITKHYKLSEDFIREFKDVINWNNISMYQTLSEPFIREFKDRVDWYYISSCQSLNEEFIKEFKNEVDWENISVYQILSWEFILEFKNFVDWRCISISQPFIDPDYKRIDQNLLKENNYYNIYQQTKRNGWFFGYIKNDNIQWKRKDYIIFDISPSSYFSTKVQIYWSDLFTVRKIKSYKFVRKFKYINKK